MKKFSEEVIVQQCPRDSNLFEKSIFSKMPEGIRPGGLALTQRLVEYCNFTYGEIVADIGCGAGITVKYLQEVRGLDAIGVDLSAVLVKKGKEFSDDLQLIQSSGEKLPFADGSVGGVLAECSLSVMPNLSQVLSEINRVLVKGGKLAITDVYARDGNCRVLQNHSSGIMTYSEWFDSLQEHGFEIKIFEDQSALLRGFIAGFIMEHGSAEELWRCIGMKEDEGKKSGLGYFLLIAEK